MAWKAIGIWVAKVLTQAAAEKLAEGISPKKEPK